MEHRRFSVRTLLSNKVTRITISLLGVILTGISAILLFNIYSAREYLCHCTMFGCTRRVPGKIDVTFEPNVTAEEAQDFLEDIGEEYTFLFGSENYQKVSYFIDVDNIASSLDEYTDRIHEIEQDPYFDVIDIRHEHGHVYNYSISIEIDYNRSPREVLTYLADHYSLSGTTNRTHIIKARITVSYWDAYSWIERLENDPFVISSNPGYDSCGSSKNAGNDGLIYW